jgi:hypothetical protein
MFRQFNLENYYNKYKADFDQLERLHNKATVNGNLLLLSFTPSQASRWTFAPEVPIRSDFPFGYTHKTFTRDIPTAIQSIKNKAASKNISYYDEPSGEIINNWYVTMPITKEILDPKTGPRVYSFNTADPDIMAQYEKKKHDLFDKIKADIEKNKK